MLKRITSFVILISIIVTAFLAFTVQAEDLKVSFVNLLQRPYFADALRNIEIVVEGSAQSVEICVDNECIETFTQAPYVVDLSYLSVGPHKVSAIAYQLDGFSVTNTVYMQVVCDDEYSTSNWAGSWSIDGTSSGRGVHSGLDGYVSPKEDGTYVFPFNGGTTDNYSNRIVISSHFFDDNHGTVARLTKADPNSNLTHKFTIQPPTGSTGLFIGARMDVRIDELNGGDMGFALKDSDPVCFGANEMGFFAIDENGERTYIPYETGRWYTLELDINAALGFFTARIVDCETNQATIVKEHVYTGPFTPKLLFKLNLVDSVALDVSIDNWKAAKGYATPVLTDVTVDKENLDHIIKAQINTNYSSDYDKPGVNSINIDTVKVYRGEEEVVVKDVAYDLAAHEGVIITLGEDIVSQSEYSVVLTKDVQNGNGSKIPDEQCRFFTTDVNPIDAKDLSLVIDEEGTYVKGTMVDLNHLEGIKYAIISVWQTGKLMDIKVKELNWMDGEVFETEKVNFQEEQKIEFAIWNEIPVPEVIIARDF